MADDGTTTTITASDNTIQIIVILVTDSVQFYQDALVTGDLLTLNALEDFRLA